ncbi:MAG: sodium:alanine symporter family protein [Bacillota bacterium]|nr:sodium:alanine symporter family protein [Bacillota bacterium]
METFSEIVGIVNSFVWGPYMLVLLVGTGVFLTFRLKLLPWRNLGYALKSIFRKNPGTKGDITPFQSLMTALSATVGVGNIAGVATAMVAGGPGALFWMWLTAIFGLSTKYAESVIAVKYRTTNDRGETVGGTMYALRDGLKWKGLGKVMAFLFALFTVVASFGIGNMTQSNTIAASLQSTFDIPLWISGILVAVFCFIVILGGIKSIAKVTSKVVPFMAVFYFVVALLIILLNYKNIPSGLSMIFVDAFSPRSTVGGALGATVANAIRYGVARGVFSNEAGLGSAPIAAAAAKTDHPCRQGYVNMTGTFIDTIIICTMTGLVIASSGALGAVDSATGEFISGAPLTTLAFSTQLGQFGRVLVTIGILLFASSTILGWSYYGEKALEYLVGSTKLNIPYRVFFSILPFFGAVVSLQLAWDISDTFNALMAVPNLLALLLLSNVIAKETEDFQENYLIPEKKAAKAKKGSKAA